MPNVHAKYSPSSITRVLQCPGSTILPKQEQKDTDAADEGTRFHEYCEYLILQGVPNPDIAINKAELKEFEKYAKPYIEYALSFDAELFVEMRLTHSNVLFGTADLVLIFNGVLYIIDIKYGYVKVHPDCDQLKTYGFMAYDHFKQTHDIKSIKTVIYQPRISIEPLAAEHTLEEIESFRAHVLDSVDCIENGTSLDYNLGDHCGYCKSKNACPEIKRVEQIRTEPKDMTSDELSKALRNADGLEHYIKHIRKYAHEEAMAGVSIPDYKLVLPNKRKVWAEGIDLDEVDTFLEGKLFKETPRQTITPTQALKLNKELPQKYFETPVGQPVLVSNKDKRTAIDSGDDEMAKLALMFV